jgi:hypothetical protein
MLPLHEFLRMKNLFLFSFVSLLFFSCAKDQVKVKQKKSIDFSVGIKIASIKEKSKFNINYKGNLVKVKSRNIRDGFLLSVKKKSSLLSKKRTSISLDKRKG